MISQAMIHNSGAFTKCLAVNAPLPNAAGTRTSAAIDRLGYGSAKLLVYTGAATGTPDSYTFDVKVTHCATSGGSYEDYKEDGTNVTDITQITADSQFVELSFDLARANRYLKIVEVLAFTGGSSPKLPACEAIVLGGSESLPAGTAAVIQ